MIVRTFCIFLIFAGTAFSQQRDIRLPYPLNGVYEGEYHFTASKPARVQGMSHYGKDWSRDAHLLWDGKLGDTLVTLLFSSLR